MVKIRLKPNNTNDLFKLVQSLVSEEEILKYFVGDISKPILSPFRKDNSPTITFRKVGPDKVIWRDWATNERGDAYSFVQKLYNCSFRESLDIIYDKVVYNINPTGIVRIKSDYETLEKIKEKKIFKVECQPFTFCDFRYWKRFGISLSTLKTFNVFSVKRLEYKSLSRYYSDKYLIYGYKFDDDVWKIYFPFSDKNRFLYNGSSEIIEGYDQLPLVGDLLIITKSLKDVMLLYEFAVPAISLQSESNSLSYEVFKILQKRFKRIIVLYDNDKAGIQGAKRLNETYGLEYRFIPEVYKTKDLTDTFEEHGLLITKQVLDKIVNEKE